MASKEPQENAALEMELLERAARVYRILSHPIRLKIVELLIDNSVPVGILAEKVGLPPAAVSQHLSKLRAKNVVKVERDGKKVYYKVISPLANYMITCLRDNAGKI